MKNNLRIPYGVSDFRRIRNEGFYYIDKPRYLARMEERVSPVTMDDLTSGFNIAANLTLDDEFNAALGFSEAEVLKMYSDFKGTGKFTEGDPAARPWPIANS